ncbi:MAG TPA: sulfate adenylyltransferase subunit CysN [Solirubrobacteraceae bacterium]|jgi:bifunctional enzyme CysN/CysC|nr:sulfate adenylyltransferase subunit CysN [Solirubrobacteraceae bacterium]
MALASADLLRIATAGSVDDGKSTLIGRLLYDSKAILADQIEHVAEASRRRSGNGVLDLSLLVDGLRAEREQGITIDVAYRYFATSRRTFIIADTPGHVQYTRNMVTGASTADLAVILVDARKGVLEQSKRHAYISTLLGIPHIVVAVNKMDLVDFAEETFDAIVRDFSDFARGLNVRDIVYVPISAKDGDNVVERSERMPWYGGTPLLEHLESVQVADDRNVDEARFPVQWVIRDPDSDYRGYAGQVAGGILRPGDEVLVLPSRTPTRIARIDTFDGPVQEAFAPMSVTVLLEDDVDVSRGDLICHPGDAPELARDVEATVCWMADAPLRAGGRYAIKHATHAARAIVEEVVDHVDVHTLSPDAAATELGLNDIGRVRLRTSKPLAFDPYLRNRSTGSFILIDEATNDTVGAGMIC